MMISNSPDFIQSKKIGFMAVYPNWQLDTSSDGMKKVYLKVFNEVGSGSDIAEDEIILYRTKPNPVSVSINEDAEWTNNPVVKISCEVENASDVQISNRSTFSTLSDWRKLADEYSWRIIDQEGKATVYVRFKDIAGNISETISSEINYDITPPDGMITINNGNQSTNTREVILNIRYDEDVQEMLIGNDVNFNGSLWQPAQATMDWLLYEKQGPKSVYYRFKDRAGNISKPKRVNIELMAQK
jgi:hypothetical protein